ncbi:casein kinase I isoform alpha-like protein [Suillus tomentosus]|nr:casein kinase I isoform alpha-like protein [Suillus tomentosus]
MKNVTIQVNGRFRLGDMLGSGSYGVVYHAWNIIDDDEFGVKLEPLINNSSSLEHEYNTLKQLQGGVGIPRAVWFGREATYDALVLDLLGPSLHDIFLMRNRKFDLCTILNIGDQLLSSLEHIHSHNYVHDDIKPQNVLIGRGASENSIFIVDFGVAKEYWSSTTQAHMPFRQGRRLTGTPAFASINNHLVVLSSSSILAHKVDTTIEVLCLKIPSEITTMLIYSRNLAFSEDPDYTYLQSLLHDVYATLPAPVTHSLDFSQSNDTIIHPPPSLQGHLVAKEAPSCRSKTTPLCRLTRHV